MLAAMLGFIIFSSSAPSPLYVVYQSQWHFSAITLTSVFAVYVVALIFSLVFAGSLSDRIGRRPVLVGALVVQLSAMVLFAVADDIEALFAARIVQGLATGVATGALSAALIDLQPAERPHLGSLTGSVAPPLGLAAGALGTGLLVEYGPDPMRLVYWLLVGVFALAIAGVLAMPEPVKARDALRASHLRPRVAVPHEARAMFVTVAPVLVASWALAGLMLSLGPSLAVSLLHTTSHVTGGLVITALTATGAITSVVVRNHAPQHVLIGGAAMLALGVGVIILGLNEEHTGLFFAGSVLAGVGFGASFSGAFKAVVAVTPPTERASLVAAVYVLAYLALSVPAIAAGIAVTHAGLLATTNVYGSVVVALALLAAAATTVRHRRARAVA